MPNILDVFSIVTVFIGLFLYICGAIGYVCWQCHKGLLWELRCILNSAEMDIYEYYINNKDNTFIVCEIDGQIAGCIALDTHKKDSKRLGGGEIKHLSVLPRWRRGFVATRLLEEVETFAIERKCSRIYAVTGPFFHNAVALLSKHGFSCKDPPNMEGKERTYFYEKSLNLKTKSDKNIGMLVKQREPTKWG